MSSYLPSYEYELETMEYLMLATFSSNLSFDFLPTLADIPRDSCRVLLTYLIMYCDDPLFVMMYPVLSILRVKVGSLHKRFNLFYYIGQKYENVGGFLTARGIVKGVEAETSEEFALMPHLAIRNRRLILVDDKSCYKKSVNGRLWYIILAALSGLHRWGLSWRRIITATLTFHLRVAHLRSCGEHFDDKDIWNACEIIALSLAEATINFATVYNKVYGEETYTIAEPIQFLRREIGVVKGELGKILSVPVRETVMCDLCRLIYKLQENYADKIYGEVCSWRDRLFSGVPGSLGLLSVYNRYSGAYNLANKVCVETDSIHVLAPTETFSPLELYIVFDMCDKLGVEDVVIVYSPEALPQVLFSIVTYQYILNKDRLPEVVRELYDKQSKLPATTLYSLKDACHRVYLACVPCKSPILAYDALKRIGKILRNDRNFKFIFAPETISTVPILAALQKLKNENKAIALI